LFILIKSGTREFDLNADRKRTWFEELRNVNDRKIIDSMQISEFYLMRTV
jgi:hypothetical protein